MEYVKRTFPLAIIVAFLNVACSVETREEAEDLEPLLRSIYQIEHTAGYRIISVVDSLADSTHRDFSFISENRRSLGYLYHNVFQPWKKYDLDLKAYSTPSKAQDEVIKLMLADSAFMQTFRQLKRPYEGENEHAAPLQEITKQELMKVGAQFFYASELKKENVVWRICVGTNPFHKQEESERLQTILVQAFCFQTIHDNFRPGSVPEFFLSFGRKRKAIEADVVNEPLEQKLAAANERMWPAMAKDEALEKLLMESYEKRKDRLGFRLIH